MDETGALAAVIDQEVRQAFRSVEQARALVQRQAQYQSVEMAKFSQSLRQLAQGDLNCDIVVGEADGETLALYALFSELAENLQSGIGAIRGYIREIDSVLSDLATGNLNVEITSAYKGDFIALKISINSIIEALNLTLGEIDAAAGQVSVGTRQMSEGNQTISQGTTEQASAIEELSSTIAEIAAQTKRNAQNADKANELAGSAKKDAADGNARMKALQRADEGAAARDA